MPRRGENIWKRKGGRWEARYIKGRTTEGRAIYGSVYAKTYLLALPLRFYIHSGSLSLCCAAHRLATPNLVIKLLLSAVNPHGEQITPALLNRHMKTQAVRDQSGILLPDRFSIYSYLPDALFSFFSACAFSVAFRFLKSL